MKWPAFPEHWLHVAATVLGGLVLGSALARSIFGFTVSAVFWSVVGVILLWWGISRWRRRRGENTPDDPTVVE
ncbi:MAG: hypothetical protein ACREKN_07655 [Longimicrobiaceae bacterium]